MADACSSSMAGSASTSCSKNFDVFINQRGPDVQDFATRLYRRLTSSGLQVFLDRPEMQIGQDICSQIKGAIQVASVLIAIFSPRYAESEWCLNELLQMVESVKLKRGTILPIFYKVNPSDLRYGAYAEALCSHEEKKAHDPQTQEKKKPRYTSQTIENWRDALSFVANISGFELEAFNGNEEELLDKVVQRVLKIVTPLLDIGKYPTGLDIGKYPTGLEEKLEEFKRKVLSQKEDPVKTKVVGIVGLGGIGKTTLAKYFFNTNTSNYEGSSFLFDVRQNRGNLRFLQSKLISDLKHKDIKIHNVGEGIEILRNNLSSYRALVILDDVDHDDQLHAFLPIKDILGPNSLILVSSRDMLVLRGAGILESSIYHLRGLNRLHSQQLFCSHAFSRPDPLPGFEDLVHEFIEACDGLPLALKVWGNLLYGDPDISHWQEMLKGLNKLLPADIENRLKVSYDSLHKEEQQMFLDISCFSIGEDRDTWIRIWEGSGWKGGYGFRNLQSKCLVDVDHYNRITMHDHLRDMGRHIADCSRSMARRLWQRINNLQEINDLLDQSSSSKVRGFRMARDSYLTSPSHTPSSSHEVWGMRKLQLLEAEDNFVEIILTRVQSPNLIWLCWHHCPYPSLPCSIPMHDLRVLEVHGAKLERLWQCESEGPVQLRELIIDAPLVEFPKSLGYLKHLEKIVARNTSLVTFPEEFSCLPSLKSLELHDCQLQRLWQCRSQGPLQLREFIIDAPLVKFPKSLWQLKHLKHLVKIVAEEKCLATLPEEFCYLPCLKFLLLKDYKMLPDDVGRLTNLQLTDCRNSEMLSESMDNLTNHQLSGLEQCTSLEMLLTAIVWRFFQNPSSI